MKYLVLGGAAAAALAGSFESAAQPGAAANVRWIRVSEDREAEYFWDPASVERLGGMIRLRMRAVLHPDQAGAMQSVVVRSEINCAEQTTAYLSFELYGEGGALLRSSPSDQLPDIQSIRHGSPDEILYRRLCPASLVRPLPLPVPPPVITTVAPPAPPMMLPSPPAPPLPPAPPPPAVRAQWLTPLASLISDDDYPAAALRAHVEGTVRVALSVSPQGRVTGCMVTGSSGSWVLDAATCRILTARARFTPARNARGRAVADTAAAGVRWVIPFEPEPEPEEGPPQPPDEQS